MAGPKDCIAGKVKAGRINEADAKEATDLLDDLETEMRAQNTASPDELAALRSVEALEHMITVRRRAAMKQLKVASAMRRRFKSAAEQGLDPVGVAKALYDFDPEREFTGLNVDMMTEVVRSQALQVMTETLEGFASRLAGLDRLSPGVRAKREANLRLMIREMLKPGSTGDKNASEFAKAVRASLDFLNDDANASGLTIGKIENYVPQSHGRRAIASVDEKEWVDYLLDNRLDLNRMIDNETGQPFTQSKLRRVLSDVYKDIVTQGSGDIQPGGSVIRNIAVKRAQRRFIHFKDADAWLEYHDRFGEGTIFDAILSHIDGMSRDISLVKVLGPNPDATHRLVKDLVTKSQGEAALALPAGKKRRKASDKVGKADRSLDNLYAVVTRAIDNPVNNTFATGAQMNRSALTASLLGGAFFTSLTDRTFSRLTSNFNGLPANRIAIEQTKMFLPGNTADKRLAARAGFINSSMLGTAIATARYTGETLAPGLVRSITDTSLRLSWLQPWTVANRQGFGLGMLGYITDQIDRPFNDLPDELRRGFDSVEMTPAEWEIIRKSKLFKDEATGAEILDSHAIIGTANAGQAGPLFEQAKLAADKMMSLIHTEVAFAVPTVTARTRAALLQGSRPGTPLGELIRSGVLFKTFPGTIIMTHLRRAMSQELAQSKHFGRTKYWAHLVIGTTVMGMFGMQMNELRKGRDPLNINPFDDPNMARKAWTRALVRGGGFGLFGDFLFADVNQFGGGVVQTALGPILGSQVDAVWKLTAGNFAELVTEGRPDNAGREIRKFVEFMTPGHTLWYGQLVFERTIFDTMQRMIDPDYYDSMRSIEQRARTQFDQEFFAPPGRAPQRLPDFSALTGAN